MFTKGRLRIDDMNDTTQLGLEPESICHQSLCHHISFTKDLLSSRSKKKKKRKRSGAVIVQKYMESFHSFTSIFQLQFMLLNFPWIILFNKVFKNKVGYGAGGGKIKAGDHEDTLRK